MTNLARTLVVLGLSILGQGCNGLVNSAKTNDRSVTIIRTESYAICPDTELAPIALLVTNASSWNTLLSRIDNTNSELRDWQTSFSQNSVAIIKAGKKSSGGYGLSVHKAVTNLQGSEVIITVSETKPNPGALNSALVTSPCLILELEGASFQSLKIFTLND
jgi:PrcB C-terminal